MTGLFDIIISFPTVIFTGLLGLILLYWIMVIVGAFDIDFLDFGSVDGALDGATEGAAEAAAESAAEAVLEGVTEGAAEGVAEAAADSALEGATEGAAEAGSHGVFAGILALLNLRTVPVTIVASFIFLFSWIFSVLFMNYTASFLNSILPPWLTGLFVLMIAFFLALPLTSLASKPFAKLFVIHKATSRNELVGKVCKISTGNVDKKFGQAEFDDGGAGMILQVRCDKPNKLRKGSHALILSFEKEREAFLIEPYDDVLDENGEN